MKRNFVKVARMRIEDVRVGDVVNRDPESELDWFEVETIIALFNGDVQLADRKDLKTVSGPFYTIVGVQFVAPAEVPEQPPSLLSPLEPEHESSIPQEVDSASNLEEKQPVPSVLETPAALIG